MNHYFLLIIGICMLFLIVNLFFIILHKNFNSKSNRKVYFINLITTMAISNYVEWNEMQIANSNEIVRESLVSLIYLINILLCLILLLILFFVKDRGVRRKYN